MVAIACLLDNLTLLIGSQECEVAFDFQNSLLVIVESISNNPKILLALHEPVIKNLLPVLIAKVSGADDLM